MGKEDCKGEKHNELSGDSFGGRSSLSLPHQSNLTQLHCIKTGNSSNHRHRRHMGKPPALRAAASTITGNSEKRSVGTGSKFV
jgi:hypothetical protein